MMWTPVVRSPCTRDACGPHTHSQLCSRGKHPSCRCCVLQGSGALVQLGRKLSVIIGEDNLEAVAELVSDYPYTSIGQLRYASGASNYLCTATLFSVQHVVTNAHCIYDRTAKTFNTGFTYAPGLKGMEAPFGYQKCVSRMYACSGVSASV